MADDLACSLAIATLADFRSNHSQLGQQLEVSGCQLLSLRRVHPNYYIVSS